MLATDSVSESEAAFSPASVTTPAAADAYFNAGIGAHPRKLGAVLRHDWPAAMFFLVCDIGLWIAIYSTAGFVRQDAFYVAPLQYFAVEAIPLIIVIQAIYIIGGYNRQTEMRGLSYTTEHLLAMFAALALSLAIVYGIATFDQSMRPSRSVLLMSFVAFAPVSLVYRRLVRRMTAASTAQRAFLVIGGGQMAAQFYQAYRTSPNHQRLEFVDIEHGRVGQNIAGPGTPMIEGDLATKLDRLGNNYSGVIVAERVDRISPELLQRLVRTQFQNTRVYTLESFYEDQWKRVPVRSIDPFWPLQMGFQLARSSLYHYVKRLMDVAVAGVLLVICSPLLAAITLLIWWRDGRPALFRQERIGRDEQRFWMLKFRTMRARGGARLLVTGSPLLGEKSEGGGRKLEVGSRRSEVGGRRSDVGDHGSEAEVRNSALPDNEEQITNNSSGSPTPDDDIYTRADDPRVTGVGRWLRKLRLDELPQLWNVLRGDMSLIGPRAEWTKCAERYEKTIPFYHFRHLVKPGITGWAQVNYPYGESDEDAIEKLKYDLYYIRHYSLKLDAMIFLKTIHTVLFARGR